MRTITIVASTISRAKMTPGSSIVRAEYTPTIITQDDTGQVTYWNKQGVWYPDEEDAAAAAAEDLRDFVQKFEDMASSRCYVKRDS